MKFLDTHGVTTLWNKIKSSFLSLNGGTINGDLTLSGTTDEQRTFTVHSDNANDTTSHVLVTCNTIEIMDEGDINIELDGANQSIKVNGEEYAEALAENEINEILV